MYCSNFVSAFAVTNFNLHIMKLTRIAAAGTIGTAVMTVFSLLVSKAAKKNFTEPIILGQLLHRVYPINNTSAQIAGWSSHLGMGILFTGFYEKYLELKKTKPTLANTLLFGLLGGATGVAMWHATLKAHPNPPGIDIKNFYKQLILAHLVFGIGTALTYKADEELQTARLNAQYAEPYFI